MGSYGGHIEIDDRWLFRINRSTSVMDSVPPFHCNDTVYSLKDTAKDYCSWRLVSVYSVSINNYHKDRVIPRPQNET
jgi:hypothetical protein